jgi:sulfite reductase alpha subunit-like flavoprotein
VTGSTVFRDRDLLPAAQSSITPQEDPAMSETPKVAVLYYSATGTVHQLAEHFARGAQEAGAEVRLLRVLELAPKW